jgi:hypothetical protein
MESLTDMINHNNTIAGGFGKGQVVGVLLMLNDAGYVPAKSATSASKTGHRRLRLPGDVWHGRST